MFIEKKEFLRYLKLTELFLEIETFFFCSSSMGKYTF